MTLDRNALGAWEDHAHAEHPGRWGMDYRTSGLGCDAYRVDCELCPWFAWRWPTWPRI